TLEAMAENLYAGNIEAVPSQNDEYKTCDYCEYKAVCGNSERRVSREIPKIRDDEVYKLLDGDT
ncbi:MAG: PD-(D/E)XK nuclease family protein, partial [Oscillospiraceae bacterium]|nr:PD-(D/E)XK nuclease family protein [Oscillospiraceae bacterium]